MHRSSWNRITLRAGSDQRHCPLEAEGRNIRSGAVYKHLMAVTGAPQCSFSKFVWGNRAPPRVQFFAWLLVQDRIQCRSNLFRKGIVEDVACAICGGNEDCDHVVLSCPFATQVRRGLGAGTEGVSAKTIWTVVRPTTIASKHYDCFLLLVCWMLWKHRNGVVFNSESPSLARFWRSCRDEARLWGHRLPPQDREVAEAWCCVFSST
nr:unnamed protein product [Digitaria exilis]